jgi:hypothetical protein
MMRALRSAWALGVVMCLTPFVFAEEPQDDLTDLLSGFDEDTETESTDGPEAYRSSVYELDGSLGLSTAYNYAQDRPDAGETDYRGFSRLRGQLALGLDVRLPRAWKGRFSGHAYYDAIYSLHGRDAYTDSLLNAMEDEVELDEAYLQGSLIDKLDAKIGRQIVVWGKSDTIRVTDVLNPLDRREPGMVDIEHLRLPVGMIRLDHYWGEWNLSALLIPEVRFSKRPAFGSDFSPSASALPPEDEPATTLENMQYGAALNGILGKWDIAFYMADVFDDRWHTTSDPGPPAQVRRHNRVRMVGTGASMAAGNWLLKGEAAYFDHLRYSAKPDQNKSRYDLLAGVEYRGFTDTAISLEAANRHIIGFNGGMSVPPDSAQANEFQTALRLIRDCMHDSLRLGYLIRLFGIDGGDGGFQRCWAEYDMTDTVKLTAGIIAYHSGNMPPYNSIGNNDRIFAEIRYSF